MGGVSLEIHGWVVGLGACHRYPSKGTSMNMITVDQETLKRMIAQAVEAEREECAKTVEGFYGSRDEYAAAIRARSKDEK